MTKFTWYIFSTLNRQRFTLEEKYDESKSLFISKKNVINEGYRHPRQPGKCFREHRCDNKRSKLFHCKPYLMSCCCPTT